MSTIPAKLKSIPLVPRSTPNWAVAGCVPNTSGVPSPDKSDCRTCPSLVLYLSGLGFNQELALEYVAFVAGGVGDCDAQVRSSDHSRQQLDYFQRLVCKVPRPQDRIRSARTSYCGASRSVRLHDFPYTRFGAFSCRWIVPYLPSRRCAEVL